MHAFTSTTPTGGKDTYLAAVLPVYLRMNSKRHGRSVTFSPAQGKRDGQWFLTPQATVTALHPIADPTPVYEVAVGDEVTIDGVRFVIREDRALDGPYLTEVTQ